MNTNKSILKRILDKRLLEIEYWKRKFFEKNSINKD